MIKEMNVVSDVLCVPVEVQNESITFLDFYVLMVEKAPTTFIVEEARDLKLYLTLLVSLVYQQQQSTCAWVTHELVDVTFWPWGWVYEGVEFHIFYLFFYKFLYLIK